MEFETRKRAVNFGGGIAKGFHTTASSPQLAKELFRALLIETFANNLEIRFCCLSV